MISKYELFTPTAKEESSKSLARVMEIQRQAALNHVSSSVNSSSWSEELRLGHQGPHNREEAFISLYQSIESAAVKRSENTKPLPSPNFPKLPQKKNKQKYDNNLPTTSSTSTTLGKVVNYNKLV